MATSTIISNDGTTSSEQYRSEKHSAGVLNQLYSREDLCDVILKAGEGGERISAHRLILVGCSEYFCTMFIASMQAKTTDEAPTEVTIDDVDGDTLQNLVTFCYTGSLELKEDSVTNLLRAAVTLKLNEVVEACCGFLQRHLKPSNCVGIAFTAEQQNFEGLLQNARKFICDHLVEVYQEQEFLRLSSVQLSELLDSIYFYVLSDEDVCHAALKWIEHDPEKRRKHLIEFLSLIRLHMLTPETLLRKVLPYCCTLESKDLILQALKAQLPFESQCPRRQFRQEQRKQILFIIRDKATEKLGLMSYCARTGKCTQWNTPVKAEACSSSGCISINENLILRGARRSCTSKTVISLNLCTMEMKTLSSFSTPRHGHCMAVLNDSIYVIGGKDESNNTLSSVERWDPEALAWSDVASMKERRKWAAAAVLNRYIFVSGGYYYGIYLSSVEYYDPNQNLWTTIESMVSPRFDHALQAHNGFIYAIGGYRDNLTINQSIERYNPSTKKWTEIQCSTIIRGWISSVSLESEIFIQHNGQLFKYIDNGHFESSQFEKLNNLPSLVKAAYDIVTVPYLTIPQSFIRH